MKWLVYYSDRTYYGKITEVPTRDVQAIILKNDDVGWVMVHSSDYYIWDNETWRGTDIFGLWDYLSRSGLKKVLFGRTLPNKEWQELYQRVKADKVFGNKNGYLPMERKP